MYKFELWVRLNKLQTTTVYIFAPNMHEAKMIGESQYGVGNVLHFKQIDE